MPLHQRDNMVSHMFKVLKASKILHQRFFHIDWCYISEIKYQRFSMYAKIE